MKGKIQEIMFSNDSRTDLPQLVRRICPSKVINQYLLNKKLDAKTFNCFTNFRYIPKIWDITLENISIILRDVDKPF